MATAAHTEVPSEGHKGAFPPFQRETFASQLVWFAIFFVILYVAAAKLMLPRVGGILAERRGRIDADLESAQKFRADSDAELAAYEKALADARARAQTIANQTRDRLHGETEQVRKGLEEQLNARLHEAERSIASTKQSALANVRGIAVDTAAAIVERLTGAAPAAPAVEQAVDAVIKR